MITINWKILEIEWIHRVGSLAKVINSVKYQCEAIKDDHTCTIPATIILDAPNSESYIVYNDVTETQVINWVKNKLGSSKVSELETSVTTILQEDIDSGKPQKHISSLPWN